MTFWRSATAALQQWEWIGILLARLAVGVLFFLSGQAKLFVPERRQQMRDTMREAGMPKPDQAAAVMSSIELAFGGLLVLGFLTPLSAVMLIGVMGGALTTTVLPRLKADSLAGWLGELLYLPEVLYVVILVWLFFAGPGWLSVDQLIFGTQIPSLR